MVPILAAFQPCLGSAVYPAFGQTWKLMPRDIRTLN